MDCVNIMHRYSISTDISAFDFPRIHQWLTHAYWSKGIPLKTVKKSFEHSLCFGAFHEADGQVGVARMVTDKATFAYLADVYVTPEHRGNGLGEHLMKAVMNNEDLQELRRMMLMTSNMHGLYEKFGFSQPEKPEIIMEKVNAAVYST